MRHREYAVRLCLDWLNERYRSSYVPLREDADADADVWRATDPASGDSGDFSVIVAELFDASDSWQRRSAELALRLDASRQGSFMLWVPPGAELPLEEPDETEWVRRVVLGASRLASGRSGEVRIPVKMVLGKVRDEGGYASVTGGLSRYWTDISTHLDGSFFLDSRGMHRFSRNEEERLQLFEHIEMLSQGLKTGEVSEFEHEDTWTVQRLPRGGTDSDLADGWAISGCPGGFEPNDGAAIRRLLRQRLGSALEGFSDLPRPWLLVLVGAYDYLASENAGQALRGFDPALSAALDGSVLVSDGEVKPLTLSRGLPFLGKGDA